MPKHDHRQCIEKMRENAFFLHELNEWHGQLVINHNAPFLKSPFALNDNTDSYIKQFDLFRRKFPFVHLFALYLLALMKSFNISYLNIYAEFLQ